MIIALDEDVSSKTFKRGDTFRIQLAAPITLGSQVIVPAGAKGQGQVIDAATAGPLGRPAKLLLAARYLEVNGAQIPLRAFRLGSAGVDNTNVIVAASFVPYVGILAGFLKGGEMTIPAGTLGQAKLGVDLDATGAPVAVAPAASPPLPVIPAQPPSP